MEFPSPAQDSDGYLQGQLLIATPMLSSGCFARSVVYMCSHTSDGAMGIIVNQTIARINIADIFSQLEIDVAPSVEALPVHFGGPVEASRGFVLHTPEYKVRDTVLIDDAVALTANVDILKDVACGKGPQRSLLALGYAGWGAGQLEAEIESNSWISAPAGLDLIFGGENKRKWERAAQSLGVNMLHFSSNAGHA